MKCDYERNLNTIFCPLTHQVTSPLPGSRQERIRFTWGVNRRLRKKKVFIMFEILVVLFSTHLRSGAVALREWLYLWRIMSTMSL